MAQRARRGEGPVDEGGAVGGGAAQRRGLPDLNLQGALSAPCRCFERSDTGSAPLVLTARR
eukprot:1961961-Rhodomonas_salina.2